MEVEIYKMRYKLPKNNRTKDNLRILGDNFVNNNENKGNIIINNKKERIKSIISFYNLKKNSIKMVLTKNIYNMSCIFKDCTLLESFSYKTDKTIKDSNNNNDDFHVISNDINIFNHMNISFNESEYNDTDNYYSISQLTFKEEETYLSTLDIQNRN